MIAVMVTNDVNRSLLRSRLVDIRHCDSCIFKTADELFATRLIIVEKNKRVC